MSGNGSRYRQRLYVKTAFSVNLRTALILADAVPYQTEFNFLCKRLQEAERDCDLAVRLHDEVVQRLRARQKSGIALPDRLPCVES